MIPYKPHDFEAFMASVELKKKREPLRMNDKPEYEIAAIKMGFQFTDEPYVGWFCFDVGGVDGQTKTMMRRKPRLLTRLMAKWFFELGWRDV